MGATLCADISRLPSSCTARTTFEQCRLDGTGILELVTVGVGLEELLFLFVYCIFIICCIFDCEHLLSEDELLDWLRHLSQSFGQVRGDWSGSLLGIYSWKGWSPLCAWCEIRSPFGAHVRWGWYCTIHTESYKNHQVRCSVTPVYTLKTTRSRSVVDWKIDWSVPFEKEHLGGGTASVVYVYNGIPQALIQSSLLYYNFSMGTTFSILYRCQEHHRVSWVMIEATWTAWTVCCLYLFVLRSQHVCLPFKIGQLEKLFGALNGLWFHFVRGAGSLNGILWFSVYQCFFLIYLIGMYGCNFGEMLNESEIVQRFDKLAQITLNLLRSLKHRKTMNIVIHATISTVKSSIFGSILPDWSASHFYRTATLLPRMLPLACANWPTKHPSRWNSNMVRAAVRQCWSVHVISTGLYYCLLTCWYM